MNTIASFAPTALTALLFAGAAASGSTDTHPLEGSAWNLTMLEGAEASQDVTTTLTFGQEDDIGGNGGCNVFGGSVDFAQSGAIDIFDVFSTLMACEDSRMRQERAFFDALESATRFTLENETLTLADETGTVLAVFVPASD